MPREVRFWQRDADAEDLQPHDDPSGFLRYVVLPRPGVGVQQAETSGAEGDAEEEGQGRFAEVELVADEGGEEGVED